MNGFHIDHEPPCERGSGWFGVVCFVIVLALIALAWVLAG